jgi:multidrug efflux pump subunit AcrA (membrane-fusion protein)
MRNLSYLVIFLLQANLLFAADDAASKKNEKTDKPIDVYVETLKEKELYDPVVYGGFISASKKQKIAAQMGGALTQIMKHPGDYVKKGEVLLKIQPMSGGQDFRNHSVLSPMNGIVSYVNFEVGDVVNRGAIVAEVSDPYSLQTTIQLSYEDISSLQTDTPIEVVSTLAIGKSNKAKAVLFYKSKAASPDSQTYKVGIKFIGAPVKKFPLGTFVRIIFKKNFRSGITVPTFSLNRKRDKAFIVTDKNIIKAINVKVGGFFEGELEITEGLKTGMKLARKYTDRPKNGDRANILVPKKRGEKHADKASDKKKKIKG